MNSVEMALDSLGLTPRRSGGEEYWPCPLPEHDDSTPSLAIREKDDGTLLFKCHPCDSRFDSNTAYLSALLTHLGLRWSDLPSNAKPDAEPDPLAYQPVAYYAYTDASGVETFYVARYEPKTFRQFTPVREQDRGLRLRAGVGGVDTNVPFGLPKLLDALDAGETVYLVEGEEDVLALQRAGEVATCNAGGAGKWTDVHSEHFRGSESEVVAVPDWDPPEKAYRGQAHAVAVAASLSRVGVSVSFARADEGKDVSDHLRAGRSVTELVPVPRAELEALAAEGGALDAHAAHSEAVQSEALRRLVKHDAGIVFMQQLAERAGYRLPKFEIVGPTAAAKELPPLEFLIEGLWPKASHGVLGGRKKSLKSYMCDAMMLAVACGKPLFDKFAVPDGPRPVFLYVGEGGEEPRRRRLQRMSRDLFGCGLEDTLLHLSEYAAPLDSDDFKRSVGRVLRQVDPALVVLDALYAFHPPGIAAGNLYERGPMLHGLSATIGHDRALVVVDHFNKTSVGVDLDSVAQAGMAQWADSWVLLDHYKPPTVRVGEFWLRAVVGSRQWGGQDFALDWNVGAFDPSTSEFATPITVAAYERDFETERSERAQDKVQAKVWALVREEPFLHSKTSIKETVKGSKDAFISAWDALNVQRQLIERDGKWGPNPNPTIKFRGGAK